MKRKSLIKKLSPEEVWDLNYVLKEEFKALEKFPKRAAITSVFNGIRIFLLLFLKTIVKREHRYPKLKEPEALFISGSANNYKVLQPVAARLKGAVMLGKNCPFNLPKFQIYWYSLPYFFKALSFVRQSEGYRKQVSTAYFERIWSTYGYYRMVQKLLSRVRPKVVVVSNDHLVLYRCVMRIAPLLNIKTVYIQHAGTAPHFPPLEFHYALLDGQQSYDNYLKQGDRNTASIRLAGSPRFDEVATVRESRFVDTDTLGIAVNPVDEPACVEAFILQLIRLQPGIKMVMRPHPGIVKSDKLFYMRLAASNGISWSDPSTENTPGYLKRINLLVANNSYIQFEAVLSGIQALQYQFSALDSDAYGFVESKCVASIKDVGELKAFFNLPLTTGQEAYIRKSIANYDQIARGVDTVQLYVEIFENEILN